MANAEAELDGTDAPEGKKSGKMGLIIGLAAALALGGGAFYAVWSGMILGPDEAAPVEEAEPAEKPKPLGDIAFLPLEPMLVSLAPGAGSNHLRFRAELEVGAAHLDDVTRLQPRVVDVLNSYLRAVDPAVLADPGALTRLRAQMLRRAQIVTGEGRVKDLLIMEFVLN